MKKVLLFLSVAVVGFTACDKDDDDCDVNVASIAGTYKVISAKYKANPTAPEQDWYAALPACEKDDLQILNANGTYTYQDAGATCGGDFTGTWSLNGNIINIDGEVGTVTGWDCNNLVVEGEVGLVAGDKLIVTYDRQ